MLDDSLPQTLTVRRLAYTLLRGEDPNDAPSMVARNDHRFDRDGRLIDTSIQANRAIYGREVDITAGIDFDHCWDSDDLDRKIRDIIDVKYYHDGVNLMTKGIPKVFEIDDSDLADLHQDLPKSIGLTNDETTKIYFLVRAQGRKSRSMLADQKRGEYVREDLWANLESFDDEEVLAPSGIARLRYKLPGDLEIKLGPWEDTE